jgi:hypothetical protein
MRPTPTNNAGMPDSLTQLVDDIKEQEVSCLMDYNMIPSLWNFKFHWLVIN